MSYRNQTADGWESFAEQKIAQAHAAGVLSRLPLWEDDSTMRPLEPRRTAVGICQTLPEDRQS